MMTETEKSSIWTAVRQVLYFAGCFAMAAVEQTAAAICKGRTFDENGFMENLQLALLLAACASFLAVSRCRDIFHRLGGVFAACCLFAACRELDSFFDDTIPLLGWKFAFLFLAGATAYALQDWKDTRGELCAFLQHPSFTMMCAAMAVILPIAQCIGHKSFVINVLHAEHASDVKELIEEGIETVGYFMLLCSAIELFWPRPQKRAAA